MNPDAPRSVWPPPAQRLWGLEGFVTWRAISGRPYHGILDSVGPERGLRVGGRGKSTSLDQKLKK